MSKNKLIRNRKDLPPWFPLTEYSIKLDDRGWIEAIGTRLSIKQRYQRTGDVDAARGRFERWVIQRDGKDVIGSRLAAGAEIGRVGDLVSVRDLTVFDAATIAEMVDDSQEGRALRDKLARLRKKQDFRALWLAPDEGMTDARQQEWTEIIDQSGESYSLLDTLSGVPLVVDINQDDRSIKLAFHRWLKDKRHILGPARSPLGPKEFAAWRTYAILPYFDLTFWAQLHGIRYPEPFLADLLWPEAKFDAKERLRKVTRPKAEQVFGDAAIVTRLSRQLELAAAIDREAGQQQ